VPELIRELTALGLFISVVLVVWTALRELPEEPGWAREPTRFIGDKNSPVRSSTSSIEGISIGRFQVLDFEKSRSSKVIIFEFLVYDYEFSPIESGSIICLID